MTKREENLCLKLMSPKKRKRAPKKASRIQDILKTGAMFLVLLTETSPGVASSKHPVYWRLMLERDGG